LTTLPEFILIRSTAAEACDKKREGKKRKGERKKRNRRHTPSPYLHCRVGVFTSRKKEKKKKGGGEEEKFISKLATGKRLRQP